MWKIVRSALQEKNMKKQWVRSRTDVGNLHLFRFLMVFFGNKPSCMLGTSSANVQLTGRLATRSRLVMYWIHGKRWMAFSKKHRYVKHDISSTLTILYIVLNQSCRAVINWQIIETTLIYFDLSCVFFPNILGVSFPTTSGHDMPWSRAPWNTSRARTSFAETMEKPFLFSSFAFCLSTSSTKNPRPRDLYMFLFWYSPTELKRSSLLVDCYSRFLVHRNPESVCSYLNLTSKSK